MFDQNLGDMKCWNLGVDTIGDDAALAPELEILFALKLCESPGRNKQTVKISFPVRGT
jgi:hypothetical protein